jgi:hypothetical protein
MQPGFGSIPLSHKRSVTPIKKILNTWLQMSNAHIAQTYIPKEIQPRERPSKKGSSVRNDRAAVSESVIVPKPPFL